jgi:protein TonB
LLVPVGHGAAPPSARDDERAVVDVSTDVVSNAEVPTRQPTAVPSERGRPLELPRDVSARYGRLHEPRATTVAVTPSLRAAVTPRPPTTAAPSAPSEATSEDTPRFTLAVAAAAGAVEAALPSAAAPPSPDDSAALLDARAVDAPARLVGGPAPTYPEAARDDGVEGDVLLEIVVGPSGAVETARVLRGLGHGLDEAGLGAVRHFRFAPATRAGRAVRVKMDWSVQFRLQ